MRNEEDVTIGRRLRHAIEGQMMIKEAAAVAGVSTKTLQRWLNGDAAADVKGVSRLAAHLGISTDQLIAGISGNESGDWETALPPASSGHKRVPIYDIAVSAGHGCEPWDEDPVDFATFPMDWLRTIGDPDSLDLLRVDGDSMEPELRDADLVFVDRSQTTPREGLFVVRVESQLLIKRLRVLSGGKAELVSNNPAYPPIVVDLESAGFEIKGRVRKAIRGA